MSLCSRALERQYSFLLLNVMRALAKSQKTCKHGAGSLRLARVAVASPSMTKFNFKQPSAATSATSATQSVRPGDGGAATEGVTRPVLSTNSSSSAFNFGPKANKATDAVLALGLDACPLKTSHSSESQPTFAISKNPNRLKEMQKPSPPQTGASEFVCLSQVAAARSCQVSLQQR